MATVIIKNKPYNNFEFVNPYVVRVQAHNKPDIWFLADTITWLWLHRFCWCYDTGDANYIVTRIGQTKFLYHIIILSSPSHYRRDHRDQNKLNNTYDNLRVITNSGNTINRSLTSANKSGVKGVSYRPARGRHSAYWSADLEINGTKLTKGFKTKEEAIQQRLLWEQEYHQIIPIDTPKLFNPDGTINHHFPFGWYTMRYLAVWWALGIQVIPYPVNFQFPNLPYYAPNPEIVSLIINTLNTANSQAFNVQI